MWMEWGTREYMVAILSAATTLVWNSACCDMCMLITLGSINAVTCWANLKYGHRAEEEVPFPSGPIVARTTKQSICSYYEVAVGV